jgi:capsular polysaccharide biosynthesis protein
MELKQYWSVIWRRKWLVLAIIVVATALSGWLFLTSGRTYEEQIVLVTRQQQTPNDANQGLFTYDRYYNWIASEYLVDDFTEIIKSDSFGQSVLSMLRAELSSGQITEVETSTFKLDFAKLRTDIANLKPSDINAYITADRKQRELRVVADAPTKDLAAGVLDAAGIVLTSNGIVPVRGQFADKPFLAQIDNASLDKIKTSLSKDVTNAAIRVILGVVAALALAFLLEYLDNSLRDERDAKRVLDLPVLGAIPKI